MLNLSDTVRLQNILLGEIPKVEESPVSIGLSSGIDSHVVLFTLLESGKKVNVYSARREDIFSEDFKCAENTAKILNLNFVEVIIPQKLDIERIKRLIYFFGLRKKTDIEVIYFMSFVFESMKNNNETVSFFGYPDHHFGLSKKAMIHYRKTLALNQKWRNMNSSERGMFQAKKWQEVGRFDYGLDVILPLGAKSLVDFFHPFTWDQLNKPKSKQPFLDAYSDYFSRVKVLSPQPLQCGDSGIREIFHQLISSDLNCNRTKNLIKLYRDIADNKPRKSKLRNFVHV